MYARILVACGVALVVLLVAWRRSYKVSHEFSYYRPDRGVVFTLSIGQLRLYCNRPQAPHERAGFGHRVWRCAPTFDVRRSPMDHAYWRWGGFSYVRGENSETHTRYSLVSVPLWLAIVLVGVAAAIAAARFV